MAKNKTMRVARTRAGGEWTEAGFWSFLRSGFRQMSRRWPPIARQAMHAARRPYVGSNKRQKWEYQCCFCHDWFMGKDMATDHIEPCGQLRSWDDVRTFLERLFCEPDGLRVCCEGCHAKFHDGEQELATVASKEPAETYL